MLLDAVLPLGAITTEWHRLLLLWKSHLDFKCSFHFPSSGLDFCFIITVWVLQYNFYYCC